MKKLLFGASLLIMASAMSFISCSSDIEENVQTEVEINGLHTRVINFNVQAPSFEGTKDSRATTGTWEDGATVYLRFTSSMGTTPGTAVYNATKKQWTLNYYGSLNEGASNSCTAIYVENQVNKDGTVISLDEHSIIYEDNSGSYIVDGGDLTVNAILSPKTGRIHMKGNAGKKLIVGGVSHYTTYDTETNLFTTTNKSLSDVVTNTGETEYLYGFFSDNANPCLQLWIDGEEAYTKFFSTNVLAAGQSGVLSIPTESNHNSWAEGLQFNIKGSIMKMIPVKGGTFTMGANTEMDTYAYSNEEPQHNVTLSDFCIAETETTSAFYYTVTNSSSSKTSKPLRTHKTTWRDFATTLSNLTGFQFCIPTEAQWEYAARGGKFSKSYRYSGSNDPQEVAWYSANSNSDYHPVKEKLPNELGLYDMSGNAVEIVRDMWSSYTSNSQIDPCIVDGSSYVVRGGSYSDAINYIRNTYRTSWSTSTSSGYYVGCRLAIEPFK